MNLLFLWWRSIFKSQGQPYIWATATTQIGISLVFCFSVLPSSRAATAEQPQSTEAWYSIEFDGKAVGYEHVRVQQTVDSDNLTCFRRTKINLKRLGRDLSLSATLWTEQTLEGQLLSFDLQRLDGEGVRLQRSGKFDATTKTFRINDFRTGARDSYDVKVFGPVNSPLISTWLPGVVSPSQPRTSTAVFFPESAGVANMVSENRASQVVRHAGRKITVTRQNYYPDGTPSKLTTVQITGDGFILRQEKRVFGGVLSLVKSTAAEALSATNSVDIDVQSLIPIDRIRNFSSAGTHLALTVKVTKGLLADIPEAKFQTAERINGQEIRLVLSRPTRSEKTRTGRAYYQPPALASTTWMPTHDRQLIKLAALGAGPERTPFKICERMQKFVASKMRRAAFSTTLTPATEVARTFRGDCTEHAVLLATLLRIKGIPTRVVSGLIQIENQFGFRGHAWVEAYIDDEWQPFDSTSAPETIRIKLADSELSDPSEGGISLFLPVLELVRRTTIQGEKISPNALGN